MKKIIISADWVGLPTPKKLGTLRVDRVRGKEAFSFEYDSDWLAMDHSVHLDPDLSLFAGPQYLADSKPNFGFFLDSSPDRWGRMLMDRREVIIARNEGRPATSLMESDYLLGVHDESRMGGLRFQLSDQGAYLADDQAMKAPPFTSIRELEQASLKVEDDNFFEDKDALKWIRILIAPGSSLGGARPKANVRDSEGNLWIAKFPSKSDEFDSGAWEFLVSQMASEIGIRTPATNCERFSLQQHTFLSRRFDRLHGERRIHFASAMTLLGYQDGYGHREGGSYLDLIELIEIYGAKPIEDIRELWKRVVFFVLVSNTDDHLRNHGFLLTPDGWRLAPAYDINPNPFGNGLSLNISAIDNNQSRDLCMEVAAQFRWQDQEAHAFFNHASKVISGWKARAKAVNISPAEQVMMERAFRLAR
ncbi:MAG: HipA domain-containing protein [Bacteroidia bacterium]|nr:HipA domain-containing protein [Bacteroidia bacterium]